MANPNIRKSDIPSSEETVEPFDTRDPRASKERIEPDQVKEWAKKLNVSTTRLRTAVQRAGPIVDNVKRFLEDH